MLDFLKNRIAVEENKPITEDMLKKTNHYVSECTIDVNNRRNGTLDRKIYLWK